MKKLSFDDLVALYKSDPAGFESYRLLVLEDAFAQIRQERGGEEEMKARRLQWQIDALRRKYKHPVALSAQLSVLLQDRLLKLRQELVKLLELTQGKTNERA